MTTATSSSTSAMTFVLFAHNILLFSPSPVSALCLMASISSSLVTILPISHSMEASNLLSAFSIPRSQTPFQFLLVSSSIFQNHSRRKIVPHLYWRRSRTNSSCYTLMQLFRPMPMSSEFYRDGLSPCRASSAFLGWSGVGGSSGRLCQATQV